MPSTKVEANGDAATARNNRTRDLSALLREIEDDDEVAFIDFTIGDAEFRVDSPAKWSDDLIDLQFGMIQGKVSPIAVAKEILGAEQYARLRELLGPRAGFRFMKKFDELVGSPGESPAS
jgi:hypothetical protein